MKTYNTIQTNTNYTTTQQAFYELCKENNLKLFRPDYHGEKGDGGTIFIDNQNGETLATAEHLDINSKVDFDFLQIRPRRNAEIIRLDLRGGNIKEKVKAELLKLIKKA